MREWVKTAGVYAGIAAATLIGAEIIARAYVWTPRWQDTAAGDRLGDGRYEHSFSGYGDLVPNQDGHWVVWFRRPYNVQTNSVGLRNVEEPDPAAFRVLALGDSQTFGPYLANEDTWPAWAENALRRRLGAGHAVQVFNAAVSGYTIVDELAYLKEKGLAFRPQLVVLGVYENDLADLKRESAGNLRRKVRDKKLVPGLSQALRSRFALFQVVEDVKRSLEFAKRGIDVHRGEANPVRQAAPDAVAGGGAPTDTGQAAGSAPDELAPLRKRYDALFDEMATLLRANNVGFAVMMIPEVGSGDDPWPSAMAPIVREAAMRNGAALFEPEPVMRSVEDAATRLFLLQRDPATGALAGNAHLSREGNAVIGRALAEWLIAGSLVRAGAPSPSQ